MAAHLPDRTPQQQKEAQEKQQGHLIAPAKRPNPVEAWVQGSHLRKHENLDIGLRPLADGPR